jgi:hypothetical protein
VLWQFIKNVVKGNIESRILPDHLTAPARSSAKEIRRTLMGTQLVSSPQQCSGAHSALVPVVNCKKNSIGSIDPCAAHLSPADIFLFTDWETSLKGGQFESV